MTKIVATFLVLATLGGAVSCGGGGGTGNDGSSAASGSGLDGTKRMTDLTEGDMSRICDFVAGLYGGYGKAVTCDLDGGMPRSITAPEDLAECMARVTMVPAACTATVSELEACLRANSTCDTMDELTYCLPIDDCLSK